MSATSAERTPREHIRTAIDLLSSGDEERATLELRAALEQQPRNSMALRLMEQIESDPRALLGSDSRPYMVRPGETMSALAQRFLGDPLLFYALARYNGLAAPDQLAAGQTLMMPRREGALTSPPALPPTPSATTTAAATPQPRGPNAARADQLRLQGLEQLNTGAVDRAVALLRQAQGLDGGNAAIQRDLDRALRIQASMLRGSSSGSSNRP